MTQVQALSGAAQAAKEKAEVPSASLGAIPRMEWVAIELLTVDHRYQRAMGKDNWSHANKILRDFKWLLCQPLCCAPTGDGRYAVVDGQHRLEAARKHPLITKLPCYVIEAASLAEQAMAFEALNGRRIGITRLQRFWAAYAAKEPKALRIAMLCEKAGVAISRVGGLMPPRTTQATFTIEKLFGLGDTAIVAGLKALAEGQPDTVNAMRSAVIFALVTIASECGTAFNHKAMVSMLQGLDLNDEIVRATAERARTGGTLERTMTTMLRERYARRLTFKAAA